MVAASVAAHWSGAGVNRPIRADNGALYLVYVDTGSDVAFRKSLDNGVSWSNPTIVFAGTATNLAVWYDRWTDDSGGLGDLIHIAYTESGADDTLYRTINTASSDALSTQTTIFAGVSTAAGGHLSITRAVGGNVYCKTVIDAGTEGGFYRLPTANVPNGAWDAARTVDEAIATLDQIILMPNLNPTSGDNQDIMAIFWDASANEISRKLYDDSANSWSESSIAGSMTELSTATAFANFSCATDQDNNRLVLVAWSNTDAANADLRCWTITDAAITETSTNVVLNSTDDQGLCSITIDEDGDWWVFYCGTSAGTETWNTNLNVYCKVSKDDGATWGPETILTSTDVTYVIRWISSTMRAGDGRWGLAFFNDQAIDEILFVAPLTQPSASFTLGV